MVKAKIWCHTCKDAGRVFDAKLVAKAKRKGKELGMGAAIKDCPECPGLVTIPRLALDHLLGVIEQ